MLLETDSDGFLTCNAERRFAQMVEQLPSPSCATGPASLEKRGEIQHILAASAKGRTLFVGTDGIDWAKLASIVDLFVNSNTGVWETGYPFATVLPASFRTAPLVLLDSVLYEGLQIRPGDAFLNRSAHSLVWQYLRYLNNHGTEQAFHRIWQGGGSSLQLWRASFHIDEVKARFQDDRPAEVLSRMRFRYMVEALLFAEKMSAVSWKEPRTPEECRYFDTVDEYKEGGWGGDFLLPEYYIAGRPIESSFYGNFLPVFQKITKSNYEAFCRELGQTQHGVVIDERLPSGLFWALPGEPSSLDELIPEFLDDSINISIAALMTGVSEVEWFAIKQAARNGEIAPASIAHLLPDFAAARFTREDFLRHPDLLMVY